MWPGEISYLRGVYDDIFLLWKDNPADEQLFAETEPNLRELILGLEKAAKEVPNRPDMFRMLQNAQRDFEAAVRYAAEKNYKSAAAHASYSLLKIGGILDGLTALAIKKSSKRVTAYGYDICLTGDTKVPLLDGTEVAMSDLVGRNKFWVYSLNDGGLLRPGLGHSARLTLKDAAVLAVTLDNGETIKCTPNHPFLMRNGEYKAAELLETGDSLMPLYRDSAPLEAGGNKYQTTYQPGDDSWKFTHRFAEARCPKGYVRHHEDLNRFNNSPDNLMLIKWEDHLKLHQSLGGSIVTEKARMARGQNMLRLNAQWAGKPTPFKRVPKVNLSQEDRKRAAERGKTQLVPWNKSEEGGRKSGERQSKLWKSLWQDADFRQQSSVRMKEKAKRVWSDPNHRKHMDEVRMRTNQDRWHVKRSTVSPLCGLCSSFLNHKVVSVTHWGTADVYDISVDKYHNFALSAGVFVHNSGQVMEPGEQESRSPNLWDQGNSPKFDRTPRNPANQLVDADAENDFPELKEFKHKRMQWPARTR
jgi:hypothetical protein